MKSEQDRLRVQLVETITSLCKTNLSYRDELKIQGLLGITLDDTSVFVVHLDEKYVAVHHNVNPPDHLAASFLLGDALEKPSVMDTAVMSPHVAPDGHAEVAHINSTRAVHPGIPQQVMRERPRSKLARPTPYQHSRIDNIIRQTDSSSPDIEVVSGDSGPSAFQSTINHENISSLRTMVHPMGTDLRRAPQRPVLASCPTPTTELLSSLRPRSGPHEAEFVEIHNNDHTPSSSSPSLQPQPTVLTKGAQKRFDGAIFASLENRRGLVSGLNTENSGFRPLITKHPMNHSPDLHRELNLVSSGGLTMPVTAWSALTNSILTPVSQAHVSPLTLPLTGHIGGAFIDPSDLSRRDYALIHPVQLSAHQIISEESRSIDTNPRSPEPLCTESHGPEPQRTEPHGPQTSELHGPQSHGPDSHGPQSHGTDPHPQVSHVPEAHRSEPHRTTSHGLQSAGPEPHRTTSHGPQSAGPEPHRTTSHGLQSAGPEPHRTPSHGPQSVGPPQHGPEPVRTSSHGPQSVGPPSQGPEPHGSESHGPHSHSSEQLPQDMSACRPPPQPMQVLSPDVPSCTPPLPQRTVTPLVHPKPSTTPNPKSPSQDPAASWHKRSRPAPSHSNKPDKTVVSKDVVCLPYEYLKEQEDKGLMVLPRRDVRAALADHGLTATIQLTSSSTPPEIHCKITEAFRTVFSLQDNEQLEFTYLSCVPGTRKLQRVALTKKDRTEKWFGARVMQMAGQGILYIVSHEKYMDRTQIMQ